MHKIWNYNLIQFVINVQNIIPNIPEFQFLNDKPLELYFGVIFARFIKFEILGYTTFLRTFFKNNKSFEKYENSQFRRNSGI